jgi:hypothetical protein
MEVLTGTKQTLQRLVSNLKPFKKSELQRFVVKRVTNTK